MRLNVYVWENERARVSENRLWQTTNDGDSGNDNGNTSSAMSFNNKQCSAA